MALRIPRTWLIFDSLENDQHDRCVDLFERPDGSCGFEEFRLDPEDAGAWTAVQSFGFAVHPSRAAAFDAAIRAVAWLGSVAAGRRPTGS
jgi:hypothetical protein